MRAAGVFLARAPPAGTPTQSEEAVPGPAPASSAGMTPGGHQTARAAAIAARRPRQAAALTRQSPKGRVEARERAASARRRRAATGPGRRRRGASASRATGNATAGASGS
eukprot:15481711-Alexandrium_andersonii.AAC.1